MEAVTAVKRVRYAGVEYKPGDSIPNVKPRDALVLAKIGKVERAAQEAATVSETPAAEPPAPRGRRRSEGAEKVVAPPPVDIDISPAEGAVSPLPDEVLDAAAKADEGVAAAAEGLTGLANGKAK